MPSGWLLNLHTQGIERHGCNNGNPVNILNMPAVFTGGGII
jgi:hypothetical protein